VTAIPTAFRPRLRRFRGQAIVRVQVKTPRGSRWISTGQTSFEKARQVCTQAMVSELQMAACANALTPEVVQRLTMGRRITCTDILDAWKTETAMEVAPDTLANYESTLRQWMAALGCAQSVIARVRRTDVYAFINAPDLSAGSRKQRRNALCSYFAFAHAHGYVIGNIAETIRINQRDLHFDRIRSKETIPITPDEFARLMASPKVTGFWRWATALSYYLGYRIRDVACLEWASVQADRLVVYPRKTRSAGQRLELALNDPLLGAGALRRIILEMVEQAAGDSRYCFPDKREVALANKRRAGLSRDYGRLLKRHGIIGKSFHSLRHACFMRLKVAGLTDEQIAHKLGHGSISSTQIYTAHTMEA
jgi:integrase